MNNNKTKRTFTLIVVIEVAIIVLCGLVYGITPDSSIVEHILLLRCAAFVSILIMSLIVVHKLNNLRRITAFDTNSKNGTVNLQTQILTIVAFAILIFGTIAIFNINLKDGQFALAVAICTAVIGYVLPDIIKSVVAYIHLSTNNHLHIGDWIVVPKQGIDGTVQSVSLMTVTIKNGDNSISSIPTHLLLSEQMKNYQKILDGDTYGRRVIKTFIIDTSSIYSINPQEVDSIKQSLSDMGQDKITLKDVSYPTLNIRLYRDYLTHWLKNKQMVSHNPMLLAFLMDPTPEGVPLQICIYIREVGREKYEALQSEITEYVILSMDWFGLRLYQRPSDFQIAKIGICHESN